MLDQRYDNTWTEFMSAGTAEEDRERFQARLYRSNVSHIFPPPVFSAEATRDVATLGVTMAKLIAEAPVRVFGEDVQAWMQFLGVPPTDRRPLFSSFESDRLRRAATTFVRPDLIYTENGPKVVEINVSAPLGGMNTHDPFMAAFGQSDYCRFLQRRGLALTAPDMSANWLSAFDTLVRTKGSGKPRVFEGVANPADIDSGRRFFVQMLRRGGYEVSSGLMSELTLTDTGVVHAGRRVDVIFTMYTWHEARLHVPSSLTTALIELDNAGLVDFIGSPASALFDNKANLELLSDKRFSAYFSCDELAVLRRHLPYTFRLTKNSLDRALAHQSSLVCKPASAYGGKGIIFGSSMAPDAWRSTIETRSLDQHESYVCQERIIPAVTCVSPTAPDGVEICLGPMVYGGVYAGTFLRQAPAGRAAVINVVQGAESGAMLSGVM